ncbi:TetR/AcrR family transcriptional regulator [Nonomuraea muscovyensis]
MASPSAPRRRGRPPGSEGRDTREALLNAALALFARQGFAATTVRQIAAEVGVRDTAIYAHFPSKQAIYDALFAEGGPPSWQQLGLDPREVTERSPAEVVPELVHRALQQWSTPRARLFGSFLLREGAGPNGMGRVYDGIEATLGHVAGLFAHWQERGLIRTDVTPRQLVWELFGPLQVPRFLFLHADATDAELATCRRWADDHVAFYLTCTTPERPRT